MCFLRVFVYIYGYCEYILSQDISRGLEFVRTYVTEHKIRGVHGPLIELFECDQKFRKCVETTAGNRYVCIVCMPVCMFVLYFRSIYFSAECVCGGEKEEEDAHVHSVLRVCAWTAVCRLFHVVVDTDDVAAQLISQLNRHRAGRTSPMILSYPPMSMVLF